MELSRNRGPALASRRSRGYILCDDYPPARLVAEINSVAERIALNRGQLSEADTRGAFIDPILGALGWDLRDVASVSREYRHRPQDNPVDYALFNNARCPVLFVEAKPLGVDLDNYRSVRQAVTYANTSGIAWCVLTNGDSYKIYYAFDKGEADERLFRCFRLSEPSNRGMALETLLLLTPEMLAEKQIDVVWKREFVDRQVRKSLSEMFRDPNASFVRRLAEKTEGLSIAEIRESLRRIDLDPLFPAQMQSAATTAGTAGESPVEQQAVTTPSEAGNRRGSRVRLSDLIAAGIITPPTEIEAVFRGQRFTAIITADGLIEFDGESYDSPSTAGGMARTKVNGPPSDGSAYFPTNGWTFWSYRDPSTGELQEIAKWRDLLSS